MHLLHTYNHEKIWTKKSFFFLYGTIVGIFIFINIYGLQLLDFTNVEWLLNSTREESLWDLTQHYLGWVYYRNSDWHFPIGLMDGLYSSPVSIVYTDSIPLFAIFFKILSPILPATFQYFGLFGLLCYALTGGFAALITRRVSKNLYLAIFSAALFCLSPVLLKRMFYHTALSAHFLLLAAFCLWLYRDYFQKRFIYILLWSILTTSSALINAYLTPMVLGIFLCSLLQELILKGCRFLPSCFFFLVPPIMSTFIFSYIAGIFYGNVPASSENLDLLSFNFLQFINPANYLLTIDHRNYIFSTQSYSSFLPVLPSYSPWQEEGFAYLGLGIILLLFLSAICMLIYFFKKVFSNNSSHKRKAIFSSKLVLSSFVSITVCFIVFLFLALSPRATIGTKELYYIEYPSFIYDTLSIFRSTGRMIWPVYYGILALLVLFIGKLYESLPRKKTLLYIILSATLLVQIWDLAPALKYKHQAYTQNFESYELPMKSTAWDYLGKNATQIMFYPPTNYGIYCDPYVSCNMAQYALKYNLSLNISYMSRNLSELADERTLHHFEERKQGKIYPSVIYVFFDISDIPSENESHLHYYLIDNWIIGTDLSLDAYPDVKPYSPE